MQIDPKTWKTPRWKTAIKRDRLSRPFLLAIAANIVTKNYSILDFGCGRGDDVALLLNEGYNITGFDPYYRNIPELIADVDICSLLFVLNVIETDEERIEVLRLCYSICRVGLLVSVQSGTGEMECSQSKTFQKYFKQHEFRDLLRVLNSEIITVGHGVLFVLKSTQMCYNVYTYTDEEKPMESSKLKSFLSSVKADENAIVLIKQNEDHLQVVSKVNNGLNVLSIHSIANKSQNSWEVMVNLNILLHEVEEISKNEKNINLSATSDGLVLSGASAKVSLASKDEPFEFDLNDFEGDKAFEIDGASWKDFQEAARVVALNEKDVQPPVVGHSLNLEVCLRSAVVVGFSPHLCSCRIIKLSSKQSVDKKLLFNFPVDLVPVIAATKSKKIKLSLSYNNKKLLVETDSTKMIVELDTSPFPSMDGLYAHPETPGSEWLSASVNKKDLLASIKDAKSDIITLIFDGEKISVMGEPIEGVNFEKVLEIEPKSKIHQLPKPKTIKLLSGMILEALRAIMAAKVIFWLPLEAASSVILEGTTSVVYVLTTIVNLAAQAHEVKEYTNTDGTKVVVEPVEKTVEMETLPISLEDSNSSQDNSQVKQQSESSKSERIKKNSDFLEKEAAKILITLSSLEEQFVKEEETIKKITQMRLSILTLIDESQSKEEKTEAFNDRLMEILNNALKTMSELKKTLIFQVRILLDSL